MFSLLRVLGSAATRAVPKSSLSRPALLLLSVHTVAALGCAFALYFSAKSPAETALYVPFFKTVVVPLGLGYIVLT